MDEILQCLFDKDGYDLHACERILQIRLWSCKHGVLPTVSWGVL